ncbi:MFS transporter [Youngiibacter multivorans]|nr:MFS transporter [Youngiibacter multivorans]
MNMMQTEHDRNYRKRFRNANIALFLGAFNTFAIMNSTQPILPNLASEFSLLPASASLSQSVTTLTLAFCLLIAGSISEVYGRKVIMSISAVTSSILAILSGFSSTFELLLIIRVLQGIALAGLPAIAMAYISEEFDRKDIPFAMGLYISGNTIGGMSGRLIIGLIANIFTWRSALIFIGVIGLINSIGFVLLLPESRHFIAKKMDVRSLAGSLIDHISNPRLLLIYGMSFLMMGSFVSIYNYIGFELIAPPYLLDRRLVSFVFLIYLTGTFSSTFLSSLSARHRRSHIIIPSMLIMIAGIAMTLFGILFATILGVALFTFGYFGCHPINSAWVAGIAKSSKAQASSLYLFFYYAGASVGGTVSGIFYQSFGWTGIVIAVSSFVLLSLVFLIVLTTKYNEVESLA